MTRFETACDTATPATTPTTMRPTALPAALCAWLLAACTAPFGTVPDGCSGVPGDERTPGAGDAARAVRPDREPVELKAVARPFGAEAIPLLYVYDERAGGVQARSESGSRFLGDPAFARADEDAYWLEVVNGQPLWVTTADKCAIASMLAEPFDFRAPPGGLHFVQFVAPGCRQCADIDTAIRAVRTGHRELPTRWTRITVPKAVGRVRGDDDEVATDN